MTQQNTQQKPKKKSREIDMLHGPLGGKIMLFALPLAVTGIIQQMFNAADVAVVGRFVGKTAMAAVGSNSPIVGLMVNLFVGISLGANVVIARLTGQKQPEKVHRAVHTAILVALISGVCMTILGELISRPLLEAMSVPDNVMPMALAYLRTYLLGMPVILLYNFESAIFRSQGDTKTPLIVLIISGCINVAGNLFFVIVVGMTANGVALSTVLSNIVSSMLLLFLLTRKKTDIRVRFRELRIDGPILRAILRIGVPAGIQGMVFSISNICIQSAVNSLGADIMAASSAAFNIEIFAYYVVNSFGQACTTFIGQNYGAGDMKRCRKAFHLALIQDMIFTLALSFGILLMGKPLLHIFNSDPVVTRYGIIRMRYILGSEAINVLIEVFSGCMRGFGYSLVPAAMAAVGICGTRIGWVFTVFRRDHNFDTLMAAYPISWAVTAAAIIIAYFLLRHRFEENLKSGKGEI